MPSKLLRPILAVVLVAVALSLESVAPADAASYDELIFVEVPAVAGPAQPGSMSGLPFDRYVDGCRVVRLSFRGSRAVAVPLTKEFVSARDPAVSFDGSHILFAGKRNKEDSWQIWRMDKDGGNKHLISSGPGDRVSPLYVGSLFYLDDKAPTEQICYVGTEHGWIEGRGKAPTLALYAANMDGSKARRIAYNPFSDFDPDVLPDGRLVYSSRQPTEPGSGMREMTQLFAVNIDGSDAMAYAGDSEPPSHMEMARVDWKGSRVYFIESRVHTWPGGGALAFVSQRRPYHSRAVLGANEKGFFHSPCPLPDGGLLVSHRANRPGAVFGIHRIDPGTGKLLKAVYSSPGRHCFGTRILAPHPAAKGRSSVVGFRYKDSGAFFCLNAHITDRSDVKRLPAGSIKHVRVIEAVPFQKGEGTHSSTSSGHGRDEFPADPIRTRRILGVAPVEPDGSFHIRVPAQIPISFQLLDENGIALAGQRSWTWVMPGESRGCIGCHEDREMAPPNHLAQAVVKPEVQLTIPPENRRSVDYVRDIAPVIQSKCVACHSPGGTLPHLGESIAAFRTLCLDGKGYIVPGSAGKSALVKRLFLGIGGKSRDEAGSQNASGQVQCALSLNDAERALFAEWVDLGARYDGGQDAKAVEKRGGPL
ncbi:PD40 domain-containing protein [Syntrophobacter fumaroxidans]|uniref:Hydrazine synthase alpha subunit middle domain-containing protein n=1 Tax=Syntrophobacter fumaroxidans (strain DSM 10017 / MPOB) TaxID=335543 RepID=A0LIQ9_SYNFM|nr:PD40 domain-containing protein [Syntrophobacter fumaroxidans]ABK17311.1 hypothetical protein Sfum_1624 [Syntrophobacter fumaroxidans MPOB]